MTCRGGALFLSIRDKKIKNKRGGGFFFWEDGESKTPERENELLLRRARRVDTGVHSDLFSKGTTRTQTHLVRFVARQRCRGVFSKRGEMGSSPPLHVTACHSSSLKLPTCRRKRKSSDLGSAPHASRATFKTTRAG